ncbi:hypothetical protein MNBD_ALPHA09-934 [hydrothermal vent metagenome]|uniref:Uncharacterized protein n=1 Tax=hydrothermal vent metagenome TaxID=652676 RepID=A0A3B0SZ17_9ZZZZ
MSDRDYNGVLNALVAGRWESPGDGRPIGIPIENIVTRQTLEGRDAELIGALHGGKSVVVVSDPITHDILGRRIFSALSGGGAGLGKVTEFVWDEPRSSLEGVEFLRQKLAPAEVVIAVGSGTVNDSVKYATYLDGKAFSSFPTSPQTAYTTGTASISSGGVKKSLTAHFPKGVFIDLGVLAASPPRLIRSAFADVICRTTAQVDWLMSHMLFGTPYTPLPYALLAIDEADLIADAQNLLSGDMDSFGRLVRVCSLMGLGSVFVGSSHSGSMAEHSMSHYIDMFCGKAHPGTLHGEQVGVTTLICSALQNLILARDTPPVMAPTVIDEPAMVERYGAAMAPALIAQTRDKAIDKAGAARINEMWAKDWRGFAEPLRKVLLPYETLWDAMTQIGAARTGEELGLSPSFTREMVLHASDVRNRFTMLDVAGHSGLLEPFAQDIYMTERSRAETRRVEQQQ